MKTFARGGKRKSSPHNGGDGNAAAGRRSPSLDDGGLAALYANGETSSSGDDGESAAVPARMSYEDVRTDGMGRFDRIDDQEDFDDRSLQQPTSYRPAEVGPRRSNSAEEWKRKYHELKADYEHLLNDYEILLAEKSPSAMKEQLSERDSRIRQLESALESAQRKSPQLSNESSGSGNGSAKKIESLNEEIQKLLEQRIELEAELAELRFGVRGSPEVGPAPVSTAAASFEQERIINNLKARIKEKDEEIEELNADLAAARSEITRLGGVMGVVAGQVERSEKRRKKAWFKRKRDPKDLTAAELDDLAKETGATQRDGSGFNTGNESDRTAKQSAAQSILSKPIIMAHHPGVGATADMAGVIVNKRILDLERENARLEGEIEILHKEKNSYAEKADRLAAQQDCLLKTIENDEANRRLIDVSHGTVLQVPRDGGSENDQLRALVRLQEAALKKLSNHNQQLEATLRVSGRRATSPVPPSKDAAATAAKEIATHSRDLAKAQADAASSSSVAATAVAENDNLRRTLSTVQKNHRDAVAKLKAHADDKARMLASLMAENERLQEMARRTRLDAAATTQTCALQLRAAQEDRAAQLRPPLFQSPQILAAVQPPLPLRARCTGEPHIIHVASPSPAAPPPEPVQLPSVSPRVDTPVFHMNSKSTELAALGEPSEDGMTMVPDDMDQGLAPGSMLQYKWTDEGYALRQAAEQRPIVRPTIQVELSAGGPFPVDHASALAVQVVPEVSEQDKLRCTDALRLWLIEKEHHQGTPLPVVRKASLKPQQQRKPTPPPTKKFVKPERSLVSKVFDSGDSVTAEEEEIKMETHRPYVGKSEPPRPQQIGHHVQVIHNQQQPSYHKDPAYSSLFEFQTFNPSAVGSLAPPQITDAAKPMPSIPLNDRSGSSLGFPSNQQPPSSSQPPPRIGAASAKNTSSQPGESTFGSVQDARSNDAENRGMSGMFGVGAISDDSDEDVSGFAGFPQPRLENPPHVMHKISDSSSNGIQVLKKPHSIVGSSGSSDGFNISHLSRVGPPLVD